MCSTKFSNWAPNKMTWRIDPADVTLEFYGLLENVEGPDPAGFLENLLITTYGAGAFSFMFAVERAHCIPRGHLPNDLLPVRSLLNSLILETMTKYFISPRKKATCPFRMCTWPHSLTSNEVQCQRSRFQDFKRCLCPASEICHVIYCSPKSGRRWRVHFFEDHELASNWLDLQMHPAWSILGLRQVVSTVDFRIVAPLWPQFFVIICCLSQAYIGPPDTGLPMEGIISISCPVLVLVVHHTFDTNPTPLFYPIRSSYALMCILTLWGSATGTVSTAINTCTCEHPLLLRTEKHLLSHGP